MAKKKALKDPFADREASRYSRPIPSREFLLEAIAKYEGPVTHHQLCIDLALDEESGDALRKRLRAMEREGQIISNRKGAYGIIDRMDLIRGRVQGHRDGFGFVIPHDGSEDLYLHNRQMQKTFDGDEVLVQISGIDRRGRQEAKIVEVVVQNTHQLVGRFDMLDTDGIVIPDSARIAHTIVVPRDKCMGAKPGQFVTVKITRQPQNHRQPGGEIIEVLGDHLAPGMEIDIAIRSHEIPHEWPAAVSKEIKAFKPEPADADKAHRVDLRSLPLVTIDGEDARDFDDAVYCERKKSGGWRLIVAIADVSHYVSVGSALDEEALNRGNSVYFPEHVVPMLPEVLSNGLCSLKPKVDRLCMVCEMSISKQGRMSRFQFYEGVMHSHARLTYTQVGRILSAAQNNEPIKKRRTDDDIEPLVPHLLALKALYETLREARSERGAIDFDTVETRIIFDDQRKISDIVPVVRNDAHKLIEECMLCANVAAAKFLEKHIPQALYRVHDGPTGEKLDNLRKFLGELGLSLAGGDKPQPGDYQALMSSLSERPDKNLIQTMMLRSMNQAVYEPDNRGHFGLAYKAYAHFTSPIRRYPDLLVHRAIRQLIRSNEESAHVQRSKGSKRISKNSIYPYELPAMLAFGERCSLTERRADDATRDVVSWLKCEYLMDRVGDQFSGVVSAVTAFGLFVELQDLYVEGLVHISSLESDYYHYDAAKQRLVGERTRKAYHLGDSVDIRVKSVNLDERKVDLELAATPGEKPARARKKGPKKGPKKGKGAKNTKGGGAGRSAQHGRRTPPKNKAKAKKTSKRRP